jgi:hypothetical protein
MKNQTLASLGLAVVMISAFGFTCTAAFGAPQRQMPMPRPAPMPMPAPRPASVPTPPPRSTPTPMPRPEPSQPAEQNQAQQRAEQQRQQQAEQERQARQAEEQQARQEQARQQEQKQEEQRQLQQEQARRQEQQKQEAEQEKHKAEEQKLAQKQQQKLQEQQRKEEARMQKEQLKQQEKQRKEQERLRKQGKDSTRVNSAKSGNPSEGHGKNNLTVKATAGTELTLRKNGTLAHYSGGGRTASFDRRGGIVSVHTANIDIRHGAHGERRIVSQRGDMKIVQTGHHNGYVERRYTMGNQAFTQRTVIVNGRVFTRTYVSYVAGGVVLHHFVTPVYFSRVFYGWVYYPWAVPVPYRWDWLAAAWYLGPNPYFVAASVYTEPSQWLTDYYFAETLQQAAGDEADVMVSDDASDLSADASVDSDGEIGSEDTIRAAETVPVSAELKSVIADEVKQQIAYDNTAASDTGSEVVRGELPAALRSVGHVFVVSETLDVTTSAQQSCALQAGDTLRLVVQPTEGTGIAELKVASSKKMDCPTGAQVTVSLQDLQDMQDNFHEKIEDGLLALHANLGKNGLPAAPADALQIPERPATTADGAVSGAEALTLLTEQEQEANALEADVTTAALKTNK